MSSGQLKIYLNLQVSEALKLQQAGNFTQAEKIYEQVLTQDAKHADALHLLGCLRDSQNRTNEAIPLLKRAIKSNKAAYPYLYNLGNMLSKQGDLLEATRCYQAAIQLKPDYVQAHNNLGLLFAKRGDQRNAKTCFKNAIRFKPDFPDAYFNLGIALKETGDLAGAIQCYRQAIQFRANYDEAYYNLGNALSLAQHPTQAVIAYLEAIRLRPDNPKIHTNLGSALLKLGRIEEAVNHFREALKLDSSDVLNHSNLIQAACYASADPSFAFVECQTFDQVHGVPSRAESLPHQNYRDPNRRLRLGYVSADFRAHAAAYWIEPLLTGHDHDAVEVFCYSSNAADEVTARLQACADHWIVCSGMSDAELAQRIRRDQIDILVDLSGHTEGNRLMVFARQPAPIQVDWFGFPVSNGLKAIHYRFTDEIIDPPGVSDPFYSEKLIRLPRFYASYRPDERISPVGPGPVERNRYITFVSINNLAKISTGWMSVWAEIVSKVPGSRLLIQAAGLEDPETRASIAQLFEKHGISVDRLMLRGWTGLGEYFSLGNEADIALDSFPFNGGVTTCHSLWMGVPVVSMSGQSAASRVGRSILSHIGLEELAAQDIAQYIDIAVRLANDEVRLQKLRTSLRRHMEEARLLDGADLAAQAELAFRQMWHAWCEKTA